MGKTKTHEEFLNEAKNKNIHVDVISKYDGCKTPLDVKCVYCGEIFNMTPYKILAGHGHRKCITKIVHDSQKKSHEQFLIDLYEVNKDISVLERYINNHTKLKVECLTCGNIWSASPNKLLLGRGCPKCRAIKMSIEQTRTHEEFLDLAKQKCPQIKILGRYSKSQIPIDCECTVCNFQWNARPSTLLYGIGCPQCKASKGERRITEFLNNYGVMFEYQKKYEDLLGVGNKQLSYDFYIPNRNLLIEYQGQFHDGNIKNDYQTKEDFEKSKEHDRRKKVYAQDHNIQLLEIWYWDFDNIEQILLNQFKEDKLNE